MLSRCGESFFPIKHIARLILTENTIPLNIRNDFSELLNKFDDFFNIISGTSNFTFEAYTCPILSEAVKFIHPFFREIETNATKEPENEVENVVEETLPVIAEVGIAVEEDNSTAEEIKCDPSTQPKLVPEAENKINNVSSVEKHQEQTIEVLDDYGIEPPQKSDLEKEFDIAKVQPEQPQETAIVPETEISAEKDKVVNQELGVVNVTETSNIDGDDHENNITEVDLSAISQEPEVNAKTLNVGVNSEEELQKSAIEVGDNDIATHNYVNTRERRLVEIEPAHSQHFVNAIPDSKLDELVKVLIDGNYIAQHDAALLRYRIMGRDKHENIRKINWQHDKRELIIFIWSVYGSDPKYMQKTANFFSVYDKDISTEHITQDNSRVNKLLKKSAKEIAQPSIQTQDQINKYLKLEELLNNILSK